MRTTSTETVKHYARTLNTTRVGIMWHQGQAIVTDGAMAIVLEATSDSPGYAHFVDGQWQTLGWVWPVTAHPETALELTSVPPNPISLSRRMGTYGNEITIAGVGRIAAKYLWMAFELQQEFPEAFQFHRIPSDGAGCQAILGFTFEGGHGVIMPMAEMPTIQGMRA